MSGKEKKPEINVIPQESIESKILLIRGRKVMVDRDLAMLYGVETRSLNQAVKRNIERFPDDFMFQLTKTEYDSLRSQFVTLKRGQHRKYMPYVFTEQGVAMLSSVINSNSAIQVNIQIMRTFTKLREMILTHKDLQKKIEEMEKNYDEKFKIVFEALRQLIRQDNEPRGTIGFKPKKG